MTRFELEALIDRGNIEECIVAFLGNARGQSGTSFGGTRKAVQRLRTAG